MKNKLIFTIFIALILNSCGNSNSTPKRGSIKTLGQTVEKEEEKNRIDESKNSQLATMPDIKFFFPEEEKDEKKYSSSIWGVERKSIYADSKASGIGDIVFISVKEAADAKIDYSKNKSGYTNYAGEPKVEEKPEIFVKKSDSIRGDYSKSKTSEPETSQTTDPNMYVRPASDAYNGNSTGNGSFSFQGQIAARITGVDKYGNLFIQGTKTALVNNEIVVLELSGFIRSQDIENDNTIDSEKVENMEFLYNGALYVRQPIITKEIGTNRDLIVPETNSTTKTSISTK